MSSSGPITVQAEQGGVEVVERLASEWQKLCDEDVVGDPRYRPEWVAAYLSAFAPTAKILVITARADGHLKAVLPLIWQRSFFNGLPVKKLSTRVRMTTTRFDLVHSTGPESNVITAAVWRCLRDVRGWQMIELGDVHPESPLSQVIVHVQSERYPTASIPMLPSPYVPIPPFDAAKPFRAEPRSQGQRTKLRKVLRSLETPPGRLQLSRIEKFDRDALERFYKLEASGWKGKEGSAILCVPESRQYHDQISEAASRLGYFSLYELYLDGQHVAGHLGFTYRGGYFAPKGAYDESYRQYDVGHINVHYIMKDCAQRGLQVFEFLGGNESWKMLWTSHVRKRQIVFIFRRNPFGHLLCAMDSRIKPAVKSLAARIRARRGSAEQAESES